MLYTPKNKIYQAPGVPHPGTGDDHRRRGGPVLGVSPVAILRPLLPAQDLPVQQDPVGSHHLRPGAALRVLLQHGGGHAQAGQVLADLEGIEGRNCFSQKITVFLPCSSYYTCYLQNY